jgi:aryl-alcohol dehydrogenase-like predicted oxidoreductase
MRRLGRRALSTRHSSADVRTQARFRTKGQSFLAAVDARINFFDTANTYPAGTSEEMIGVMLREFTRRDWIVGATKVFYPVHDNGAEPGRVVAQGDPSGDRR